jgi:hypothetical protein
VLIQNESDHPVRLYVSHTWYEPSVVSKDKKWYYVEPHQSIKVVTNDVYNTRIYMYRYNLSAALGNIAYLGTTYAGSVAVSASNWLGWGIAAWKALKTTWEGLPFTKQTIEPAQSIKAGHSKTIIIENFIDNENTIQSHIDEINLEDFIFDMASKIGLAVHEHTEFEEQYFKLRDYISKLSQASEMADKWEIYEEVRKTKSDLDILISAKLAQAQKKSIPETINDFKPIIDKIPTLKLEFAELREKTGLDFYLGAVKLAQKVNKIRLGERENEVPELPNDEINDNSTTSSSSSAAAALSDEQQPNMPPVDELD